MTNNAEPRASGLLDETIAAHDPDGRWDGYSTFAARMTVGGALWGLKKVGGLFDNVLLTGEIGEERDTIAPFTAPDRIGVFTPERTTIETADGTVLEERLDPLDSFAGQERLTPWDPMQALYFASYANWNYFVAPFIYRSPGFSTKETGEWEEDGQRWRMLEITYPFGFATHSQVQTIYVDDSGLIARLDYSVDILGGGPAAHYSSRYREFDGILVPTKREVYVRNPDGTPIRDSVSIDIDVTTIGFN
jgi:hypothetical protein